jgi:hypothetical protein
VRGYYDTHSVYDMLCAYDVLMSFYRSDQHAGGISPVEERYIRDTLAAYVHEVLLWTGDQNNELTRPGMWDTARRVAAIAVAAMMPTYDSPVYGKSGYGTSGPGYFTAFPDQNPTWKQVFDDDDTELRGFPNQALPMSVEESARAPLGLAMISGQWQGRTPYTSWLLMGRAMWISANLMASTQGKHWPLLEAMYLNGQNGGIHAGGAYGENPTYAAEVNTDVNFPIFLNHNFPTLRSNGLAKPFPGSLTSFAPWALVWYEDATDGGAN